MLIYLQMIETPEDRSKFEIIYEECRDMLYTRANGILHNKMDAEDATHQAFVKIAENIKKYLIQVVQNRGAISLLYLNTLL